MQLPITIRDSLVEELDDWLEAYTAEPEPELIVAYLFEQLELLADEEGIDEVLTELEEEASLVEGTLAEGLETEMETNAELEFTGEEIVSLLERLTGLEWERDEEDATDEWGDDDDDDDDGEDDDDEWGDDDDDDDDDEWEED